MDNGPIVIELDQFLRIGNCRTSEVLVQKASWLQQTFECFQETENSAPKPRWNKVERPSRKADKPRIGNRDLSNEAIARKDFLGLMNKLSSTNKEHMIKQMRASLRPEFKTMYVQIIWDFMLRAPDFQDIYSDVYLNLSCNIDIRDDIQELWTNYFTSKNWIPPTSILENNEEYDEFCEYVKWKKRAIAAIRGWIYMCRKMLLDQKCEQQLFAALVADVNERVQAGPCKVLEVLLEQLLAFLAHTNHDMHAITPCIGVWSERAPSMPPSMRFKLYDVRDIVVRKNERKR
jgi:hypothetical protein